MLYAKQKARFITYIVVLDFLFRFLVQTFECEVSFSVRLFIVAQYDFLYISMDLFRTYTGCKSMSARALTL